MEKLNSLYDLFVMEMKKLYDLENRMIEALPEIASSASTGDLRKEFQDHLEVTKKQVSRIDDIFEKLDINPEREKSDAIVGILKEAEAIAKAAGNANVKDAGLIGAMQKAKLLEVSFYGTLRTWAKQMEHDDIAEILQETLDEERDVDKKLTSVAVGHVNVQAPVS